VLMEEEEMSSQLEGRGESACSRGVVEGGLPLLVVLTVLLRKREKC
jgi:hypothetical protein